MSKITVMLDGMVVGEFALTSEKTTLGRRPYNDVVLDNLTVSGEHAVLHRAGNRVTVEDLHSTNGTYLGGKAIKKEDLRNGDVLEMGKYRIRFEAAALGDDERTTAPSPVAPASPAELRGSIKVLSGPATGREMALTKVVTTIGKPGLSVAAITQRRHNFFVHHIEGTDRMTVNGETVGEEPCVLHHGDRISLAGTEMQFVQT